MLFLDSYQLKSQNAILNADVLYIRKNVNGKYQVQVKYNLTMDEDMQVYEYDKVIACTGFRIDTSYLEQSVQPQMAIGDHFAALEPNFECVNVPNLFVIGTLMQMRDFKKKQSGFIHGYRYNVRFLAEYFEDRYEKRPLPKTTIANDPAQLTNHVLNRLNISSALWQQTGFLADCLFQNPDGNWAYYKSLPVDFIHAEFIPKLEPKRGHYFTVTLEFGQHLIDQVADVFAFVRVSQSDVARGDQSTAIHPIIRKYDVESKKLLFEHHIVEKLEAVWRDEQLHEAPTKRMFMTECAT